MKGLEKLYTHRMNRDPAALSRPRASERFNPAMELHYDRLMSYCWISSPKGGPRETPLFFDVHKCLKWQKNYNCKYFDGHWASCILMAMTRIHTHARLMACSLEINDWRTVMYRAPRKGANDNGEQS